MVGVIERPAIQGLGSGGPDLGFQGSFFQPPIAASPSLEDLKGHKSAERGTDAGNGAQLPLGDLVACPDAIWLKGACVEHGVRGWCKHPCKRRTCEICGPLGRQKIADRIAFGVRWIESVGGWCAWLVLTFGEDVDRKTARDRLASYIRWLRTKMPGLEYAATYELTERGRLHINLILGPWKSVPQAELQDKWGSIVWVEWVDGGEQIGKEVAKTGSPEALARYLAKVDQSVPDGHRVSYSGGWAVLPAPPEVERKGEIVWRPVRADDLDDLQTLFELNRKGAVVEGSAGVYHYRDQLEKHPDCHCYELVVEMPHRRRRGYRERHGQVDIDVGMSFAAFEDAKVGARA